MLTLYDLQALLNVVIEDLKSHTKLRLPVKTYKRQCLQILPNCYGICNYV